MGLGFAQGRAGGKRYAKKHEQHEKGPKKPGFTGLCMYVCKQCSININKIVTRDARLSLA